MYCWKCQYSVSNDALVCSHCNNDELLNLNMVNDAGDVTITSMQSEIWIAYIDDCYEIARLKLTFNEIWEGYVDQLIGIYPTAYEMEKGIRLHNKQSARFCD